MEEIQELRRRMQEERPTRWEDLPDIALYMDQLISYMPRQLIRFDQSTPLTSAMVNNYIKSGLVPRAEGKKYNREHLAYLTAICVLKRVMSTRDMDLLIREELRGERTVEDGYTAFCESLNSALQAMAQEMEARPEDDTLADAAIHFALISYAAGLASSRYVSLLREKRADETAHRSKKEKERD